MIKRTQSAWNKYGNKPKNESRKSGFDLRLAVAVFTSLAAFLGAFLYVQGTGHWMGDDVSDPTMTIRMERAQEVAASYASLAPWLTDCKAKSKSNPATCYFGTPDKKGVTPISKLVGEGVAAVSAGKKYEPTVAFAAAMKSYARTNVKRMPKNSTDRKAWSYLMHSDDSAPMCMTTATGKFVTESDQLFSMGRCYNIALFSGYNRTDAPYPPYAYVPRSVALVIAVLAFCLGFLIYKGRRKKQTSDNRPKDYEDTTIMEAVR